MLIHTRIYKKVMSKYRRKVSKLYAQSVYNVLPSPLFCFQNCSNRLLALLENHYKIQADLVRIKRLLASVMAIRRLKDILLFISMNPTINEHIYIYNDVIVILRKHSITYLHTSLVSLTLKQSVVQV